MIEILLQKIVAHSPSGPKDARWFYEHPEVLASAPESLDPLKDEPIQQQYGLFIDGKFVEPKSGEYLDVINPATGKVLSKVAVGGEEDVDLAVKAARAALKPWQELSMWRRVTYIYALARGLQRNSRRFAIIETLNNGKPIREARDLDIPLVIRHILHHAGIGSSVKESFGDSEPVGVVGQVIPWNFPLLMLAWKVLPALVAGNTVVLKPAEFTPLTALEFARLAEQVGLPKGVLNIVTGKGETGAYVVKHPDVDKVAFTGSTEVGKVILKATADSHKKVSLELGGKSANIVYDSADIDSAVEGCIKSILGFNQGQVCCAGSRLLIQENIYDEFIRRLKIRMERLVVGDPMQKNIDVGAINSWQQLTKITGMVEQGRREGAKVWQPDCACPKEGLWYPPTLVEVSSTSNILVAEEIFGPVLVAQRFRNPDEALMLANTTPYGLAASVWTQDIALMNYTTVNLKAGTVWQNCAQIFDAGAPFGGYKQSGIGREGGEEGMMEYLKPKPGTQPLGPEHQPGAEGTLVQLERPVVDQTIKHWITGAEKRPDGGSSLRVQTQDGRFLGEVPKGARKDIRDAVNAARNGFESWRGTAGHGRLQLLMFLGERISERREEIAQRIADMTQRTLESAQAEVDKAVERCFYWAGWADRYGGRVVPIPGSYFAAAIREPVGVKGIITPDDLPLLGFISTVAPALAMGNAVVAIPSEKYPLALAPIIQVIRASDIAGSALQIVFGQKDALAKELAEHPDVDGIDYFGTDAGSSMVRRGAVDSVKRFYVNYGEPLNWFDDDVAQGEWWRHRNTEVKMVISPFGSGTT